MKVILIMKRKFLIATHGIYAKGICNAAELIMGKQNNIFTLCAYTDGNVEIKDKVKEIVSNIEEDEKLIVLTDIFGGSVNNEFMKYLNDERIYLITGANLPLVLELISSREDKSTEKIIEEAIDLSREQIKYCNLLIQQKKCSDNNF